MEAPTLPSRHSRTDLVGHFGQEAQQTLLDLTIRGSTEPSAEDQDVSLEVRSLGD
jgi:hypothetical protein